MSAVGDLVQRSRLRARQAITVQAAVALNLPEGKWKDSCRNPKPTRWPWLRSGSSSAGRLRSHYRLRPNGLCRTSATHEVAADSHDVSAQKARQSGLCRGLAGVYPQPLWARWHQPETTSYSRCEPTALSVSRRRAQVAVRLSSRRGPRGRSKKGATHRGRGETPQPERRLQACAHTRLQERSWTETHRPSAPPRSCHRSPRTPR